MAGASEMAGDSEMAGASEAWLDDLLSEAPAADASGDGAVGVGSGFAGGSTPVGGGAADGGFGGNGGSGFGGNGGGGFGGNGGGGSGFGANGGSGFGGNGGGGGAARGSDPGLLLLAQTMMEAQGPRPSFRDFGAVPDQHPF